MTEIIESRTDPALLEALSANFAEELACFGRYLPGAELHEDPELAWFICGPGRPNGVLQARFASSEKTQIEAGIAATIEYFKARRLTRMNWRVTPVSSPPTLAEYLQAFGFKHHADASCLALDLSRAPANTPVPADFVILEAQDDEAMRAWRMIEEKGFDVPPRIAEDYYQVHTRTGYGTGHAWHHYIGWLRQKPVAISSLLLHAGLAGIYGVATLPEARRQGIGAAITLHTLHEAARLGYRVATLSPTSMSRALYCRLGFSECCKIQHYTLSLKDKAPPLATRDLSGG